MDIAVRKLNSPIIINKKITGGRGPLYFPDNGMFFYILTTPEPRGYL